MTRWPRSRSPTCTQLALPLLVSAPELTIDGNAALHHLALPVLTAATSLSVVHNHQLPSCEVVALFAGITAPSKVQLDNDDAASCVQSSSPGEAPGGRRADDLERAPR